jgi:hypothetical protein
MEVSMEVRTTMAVKNRNHPNAMVRITSRTKSGIDTSLINGAAAKYMSRTKIMNMMITIGWQHQNPGIGGMGRFRVSTIW